MSELATERAHRARPRAIEAQSAMIVKDREADLLQILIEDYGQTAFRNPNAFQRARMLLSAGGQA